MGFEWIVLNGSCAACLALAGYHDEEPARPHVKCDCDIFEDDPGYPPGTCWAIAELGSDLWIDGMMVIEIDVYKICPNGDEISTSFHMDQLFDEWYEAFIENPGGEEWADWHDELYARIDATCAGELEDRCTTFVDPTP